MNTAMLRSPETLKPSNSKYQIQIFQRCTGRGPSSIIRLNKKIKSNKFQRSTGRGPSHLNKNSIKY